VLIPASRSARAVFDPVLELYEPRFDCIRHGIFAEHRPEESIGMMERWLARREPISAGTPRAGVWARAEPATRALGLPIGALRAGASLLAMGAAKVYRGRSDVAADRRAA
jgi:hypothetical protein